MSHLDDLDRQMLAAPGSMVSNQGGETVWK